MHLCMYICARDDKEEGKEFKNGGVAFAKRKGTSFRVADRASAIGGIPLYDIAMHTIRISVPS